MDPMEKQAILGIMASLGGMLIAYEQQKALVERHPEEEFVRKEAEVMREGLARATAQAVTLFTLAERLSPTFREDHKEVIREMSREVRGELKKDGFTEEELAAPAVEARIRQGLAQLVARAAERDATRKPEDN